MKTRFIAISASLLLVLGACGSDTDSSDNEDTAASCTSAEIEERGEPEVEVPDDAVTELEINDIIEGSGDEVTAGADVEVQYVGVQQSNGEKFDSSWDRGESISFNLNGVIAGWTEGLLGMKECGRRELVIPSDMAYGDDETTGSPTGTLVFIVDLVSIEGGDEEDSEPVETEPADLSCQSDETPESQPIEEGEVTTEVILAREEPEDVTVPTEPATELGIVDLIEGNGDEVAATDIVTVNYVGYQQSNCTKFESSFGAEPATFGLDAVIAGWTEGLTGMKIGGRRMLTIPADMAYGDDESTGRPTGTLVFVIDMISITEPLEAEPAALTAATDRGEPEVAVPDEFPAEVAQTDEVVGDGAEVAEGSTVLIHYKAVAGDGEDFDSSWGDPPTPQELVIAEVGIPGFAEAMLGMKVGGRRTLLLPGSTDATGVETTSYVFVIDLLAVR